MLTETGPGCWTSFTVHFCPSKRCGPQPVAMFTDDDDEATHTSALLVLCFYMMFCDVLWLDGSEEPCSSEPSNTCSQPVVPKQFHECEAWFSQLRGSEQQLLWAPWSLGEAGAASSGQT